MSEQWLTKPHTLPQILFFSTAIGRLTRLPISMRSMNVKYFENQNLLRHLYVLLFIYNCVATDVNLLKSIDVFYLLGCNIWRMRHRCKWGLLGVGEEAGAHYFKRENRWLVDADIFQEELLFHV